MDKERHQKMQVGLLISLLLAHLPLLTSLWVICVCPLSTFLPLRDPGTKGDHRAVPKVYI
jgi:hypothetical protein